MKLQFKTMSLAVLASAALVACGGGGGGVDSPATSASLAGTAAVGAPLRNATVILKDSNGKTLTTSADANGAYAFDSVASMVAPFMVQASGTAGGVVYKLHSFLSKAPDSGVEGVLNVTPATESAVAQAIGKAPSALFDATDAAAQIKAVDGVKLTDAKARLAATLGDVLAALGLDSAKVDVFTTAFAANGAGMDKLLDIIQFQAADNGSGAQVITVTNKNTGAGVSISPSTQVSSISKIVPPSADDLALNTSTISTLISAFNAQGKTAEGINSGAMLDLFDANYLSSGQNRTAQLADIAANAVGLQLSDYVLQGCDGAAKKCKIQITLKRVDGSIEKMETQVVQGTDAIWRVYGNRIPFDFGLKPVVRADYFVTNGVAELSGSAETGFNFWFPGKSENSSTRLYKSATLQTSSDNGVTWGAAVKFAEKAACPGRDYLPVDGANAYDCGNFMAIPDASATANNTATLAGLRKFKITAYPQADYTGTPVIYEERATRLNFTSATGQAALTNYAPQITTADLGSNSLRFAGSPTYVQIKVVTMSGNSTLATGRTSWGSSKITSLGGVASVAKANALCLLNGDSASVCDASYGANAKISGVHLESRDDQQRGIWVDYYTNVQ